MASGDEALRKLPAVHALIAEPEADALIDRFGRDAVVTEAVIAFVAVQGVALARKIGHHQIQIAVPVHVAPGDAVEAGQPLLVVEAMKMETAVVAPRTGTVSDVFVSVGDVVAVGDALVAID